MQWQRWCLGVGPMYQPTLPSEAIDAHVLAAECATTLVPGGASGM